MPNHAFRGHPSQLLKAFRWSMQGLRAGWQHEASFRLEVLLAVVLVPLGLWLGQGAAEKAVLVLPIFGVLAAELLNSAVEAVVDLVSPQFHELAGRAKDLGSAAAFVMMVATGLCWLLVLVPRWF